MAFQPSTDFTEVWTSRVINRLRRNSLAYLLGNRSSEGLVQSNQRYHIANPTVTVSQDSRNRDGTTGALADIQQLKTDSGSLEWLTINVLDNRHFQTQIDQRDINYVNPVTLGSMQAEMISEMTLWLDDRIWEYLKTQVGAGGTTAMTDTGGVTFNHDTGKIAGGTNNQQMAAVNSFVEWVDDINLALGMKNARPNIGTRDTINAAVVMPVPFHKALRDWLLSKYDNTDQIVIEQLTNEASIFGGFYAGSLFGLPLFVTNPPELLASDATSNAATALFRAFAVAPGNTWDNAVASYPMGVSTPSGTSVKYSFQQELEVWAGIVNPDTRGMFRQFTAKAS